jgi:hypothetical protein
MPEKPKANTAAKKRVKVVDKADTWAEDQKTRDYYYDDSHGYVTYDPENDNDEPEDKK